MWSKENAGINPDYGKTIDNKTERNKKSEDGLVLMDVGENQIFAYEGGRYRKTGNAQTAYQEKNGDPRMLVRVTVKLVKINTPFMIFQPAEAQESKDT